MSLVLGAQVLSDYRNRHVQFFASPTDLLQAYPLMRPKLVLAVPPSMSHGPSRWLFTAMANVDGNVILLTSRGEEETLACGLYSRWEKEQEETAKWGKGRTGNLAHLGGQLRLEVRYSRPNRYSVLMVPRWT